MLKAYERNTGKRIKCGDVVTDFRGDKKIFVNATRKTEIGKSGKVTILNGGEYYDKVFNLEVREVGEYLEKELFVKNELKELVKEINDRICSIEYIRQGNYEEFVEITFINGYTKKINVTADSLKAITIDVLKGV